MSGKLVKADADGKTPAHLGGRGAGARQAVLAQGGGGREEGDGDDVAVRVKTLIRCALLLRSHTQPPTRASGCNSRTG